jgi:uncharacterized RDD family membrane protein YckC
LKTNNSELRIRTPEGIIFSLQLAGPVTRFLAWAIDLACLMAVSSVLGSGLEALQLLNLDVARALMVLILFVIQIGYGIAAEWLWRGQTIGKRLLHLRVVDAQGLRLHPSQIVIRNLLRFVDSLPGFYLVGGLFCLFSRKAQRLGDLAANTIVLRTPEIAEPDLDQLMRGKFNSLLEHAHLAGRLRQRVSPEEARLALQALLRREELDPSSRVALFEDLAAYFKGIVPFPQEASDGLADEQYVRNVVDVLYRNRK